jgi:hypothetical protein
VHGVRAKTPCSWATTTAGAGGRVSQRTEQSIGERGSEMGNPTRRKTQPWLRRAFDEDKDNSVAVSRWAAMKTKGVVQTGGTTTAVRRQWGVRATLDAIRPDGPHGPYQARWLRDGSKSGGFGLVPSGVGRLVQEGCPDNPFLIFPKIFQIF